MSTVYLNGEYVPAESATVSVLDRGFLFGDGVYEVIPSLNGKPFGAGPHLERLQRSLDAIGINLTVDEDAWLGIIRKLIEPYGNKSSSVYIEITRGAAAKRHHLAPENINPTIFAMATQSVPKPYEELAQGGKAITEPDVRWQLCHIKSINLLPNVMLYHKAHNMGCDEAILIRDGLAIEGTSSNLFIVKDGKIITPPTTPEILGGVTRQLIINLAKEHELDLAVAAVSKDDLRVADEIWMTGSTKEILPIIELDGEVVGDGAAGPMWEKVFALYQDVKAKL